MGAVGRGCGLPCAVGPSARQPPRIVLLTVPMIRHALLAFALASVCALAGCKQGVGDRCQVNSDCDDDLICVLPVGGTPQSGGVCAGSGGTDMASGADFSALADLSTTD